MMRRLAPFLAAALLAACTGSTSPSPSTAPPEADAAHRPPPTSTSLHPAPPGSGLPDPALTPGALNPAVTQATLGATICRPGYTATIRPPASYTDALKRRQMVAYHRAGPASAYREDHEVPLEAGGAPTDPANLWPEADRTAPEAVVGRLASDKDRVENAARQAICSGRLTLADAQHGFMAGWPDLGHRLGVL